MLLISSYLLRSCASSETVDAPWNKTALPVVFSIITPDRPVKVYLSKSVINSASPEKAPYPEAKVFISEGNDVWIEIPRLKVDTNLFVDVQHLIPIKMGNSYALKVVLAHTTVSAQTTLPAKKATILEVSCTEGLDTNAMAFDGNFECVFCKIDMKFQKPLENNNQYLVNSYDLDLLNTPVNIVLTSSNYQSDEFCWPKDSTAANISLHTIDPRISDFVKAQEITNTLTIDNILFSLLFGYRGVLPTYSNIINGVGLFSYYLSDTKRVELKKR